MAARGEGFKYSGGSCGNDPAWRVVIAPGPSRRARWWVTSVAAAALAAALGAPIAPAAQAAIAVCIACAAVRGLRRHGWQEGPGAIRRFVVDLTGRVEVESAGGGWLSGKLVDGSFVAPWLAVVHWRPEGARFTRTLLVAPDAVGEDEFRRLRVLLRWR